MIQCDSCKEWYHFLCLEKDENDNDKGKWWSCDKCIKWAAHLEENLLDMIYGYQKLPSLLNEDGTYWKGIDSIVNYMEDSDWSMQVPVRFFEHILINKAWHVLAEQMMKEIVKDELIENHI
jgi:PHD-finger